MSLLDDLWRGGGLRTLDHALAQSLRRLDPATPDLVLAAAALASLAIAQGHAAFDPDHPRRVYAAGAIDWPDADQWRDALAASRWVTTPDSTQTATTDAPLVLEHGLLYLRRYREYEHRLASRLQSIAAQTTPTFDTDGLAAPFARLFPDAANGDVQARAAALALLRPLLLITGGPGTGKTTTIARLLLLLATQADASGSAPPRIALTAPTGRAADRMATSVVAAATALRATPGIDPALCDLLPHRAQTLHRLLGTIPGSPSFRHDADHPLPYDVVVVDEASMIDLPLMCKLVEAIGKSTRLVLLGDPDQLPSVEAGDVLAAIVAAAGDTSEVPLSLQPLLGSQAVVGVASAASSLPDVGHASVDEIPSGTELDTGIPATPTAADPVALQEQGQGSRLKPLLHGQVDGDALSGCRVHLTHSHRQSAALDLAPLAAAVRDGNADRVLALLRGGSLSGVHFHEDLADPLREDSREHLLAAWRAIADSPDAATALALASRLRLLTALRDGPQGANSLNLRIEEALVGARRETYFHGRLLLVTENSYRNDLFNGDIGVCLRDRDATISVCFADGSGGVRRFHPAALPAHAGAFATTVHKAQGSEFDSTWLLLPQHEARALSRELLYTALTRARDEVHVCGSEAILRATLARHAHRTSGLAWRLSAPDESSGATNR